VLLLLYLVAALCAVAAHERSTQALRSRGTALDPVAAGRPSTLAFGLRWLAAAAVLAGPLFLLTPRTEESPWDPMRRFSMQPDRGQSAQTGFSDEIDLLRSGVVGSDDTPVFTVQVTDAIGRPERSLPSDQRWRGIVLDRYDEGKWISGQTFTSGGSRFNVRWRPVDGPGLLLTFHVPQHAGGLFLAEPIGLGPEAGLMPVRSAMGAHRHPPLFYEAGGTALALTYLTETEYRYVQSLSRRTNQERYPALRVPNGYQQELLMCRAPGVQEHTFELVERLARQELAPDAQLLAGLERRRRWGAPLPPVFWEPLARMLTDHLARSGEYSYSLEIVRREPRLDPVLDFLTNVKQGHCERYASALALMLRALGIPTRVVKGFRGADYLGEGKYQVRNSQAHAWVEALVSARGPGEGMGAVTPHSSPKYDWLFLDPTPDTDPPMLSALTRLQRSSEVLWRDLFLGYSAGDQTDLWQELLGAPLLSVVALVAVAGLLLALVLLLVRRHRWSRRTAPATEAGPLLDRLCRLLARHAGLRRRRSETQAELAERAAAALTAREATVAVRDVPAAVVATYYRTRYGAQAADEAHLRDLRARLDALAAALRLSQ
jgi:hypothetical protein